VATQNTAKSNKQGYIGTFPKDVPMLVDSVLTLCVYSVLRFQEPWGVWEKSYACKIRMQIPNSWGPAQARESGMGWMWDVGWWSGIVHLREVVFPHTSVLRL